MADARVCDNPECEKVGKDGKRGRGWLEIRTEVAGAKPIHLCSDACALAVVGRQEARRIRNEARDAARYMLRDSLRRQQAGEVVSTFPHSPETAYTETMTALGADPDEIELVIEGARSYVTKGPGVYEEGLTQANIEALEQAINEGIERFTAEHRLRAR